MKTNFEALLGAMLALVLGALVIVRASIGSTAMTWRLCAIIVAATPVVVLIIAPTMFLTSSTFLNYR